MVESLPPIKVVRKSGGERFHLSGHKLPVDLLSFWQWSVSDLVSNVTRGRLAEFIVASALEIDITGVRAEWDAFDLTTTSGLRIEVKSAAHVQSWYQARLSDVVFRTPQTREWSAETNVLSSELRRQADVYVLALLRHQDKATIDPLDLDQWCFFVLPTKVLDARTPNQNSITLKSLKALAQPVSFSGLASAVSTAGQAQRGAL